MQGGVANYHRFLVGNAEVKETEMRVESRHEWTKGILRLDATTFLIFGPF